LNFPAVLIAAYEILMILTPLTNFTGIVEAHRCLRSASVPEFHPLATELFGGTASQL